MISHNLIRLIMAYFILFAFVFVILERYVSEMVINGLKLESVSELGRNEAKQYADN